VNKKKQKNFNNFWPVALERPREAEQKFFGSFFQKRTPCFYLLFQFFGRLGSCKKRTKKTSGPLRAVFESLGPRVTGSGARGPSGVQGGSPALASP
jgi:hypothetical protein